MIKALATVLVLSSLSAAGCVEMPRLAAITSVPDDAPSTVGEGPIKITLQVVDAVHPTLGVRRAAVTIHRLESAQQLLTNSRIEDEVSQLWGRTDDKGILTAFVTPGTYSFVANATGFSREVRLYERIMTTVDRVYTIGLFPGEVPFRCEGVLPAMVSQAMVPYDPYWLRGAVPFAQASAAPFLQRFRDLEATLRWEAATPVSLGLAFGIDNETNDRWMRTAPATGSPTGETTLTVAGQDMPGVARGAKRAQIGPMIYWFDAHPSDVTFELEGVLRLGGVSMPESASFYRQQLNGGTTVSPLSTPSIACELDV